jgi:hypothetical protein
VTTETAIEATGGVCPDCGKSPSEHKLLCPSMGSAGAPGAAPKIILTEAGKVRFAPTRPSCAFCGGPAHRNDTRPTVQFQCVWNQVFGIGVKAEVNAETLERVQAWMRAEERKYAPATRPRRDASAPTAAPATVVAIATETVPAAEPPARPAVAEPPTESFETRRARLKAALKAAKPLP